ncbi:MAG: hypothetical protein HOP23_07440 [Methylococcaceae bacterium]|nr:hypothetical protein [Methylococcaceae bacterium]
MKTLKKLLLSLLIASSLTAISTSALAGGDDRTLYAPAEAIDLVSSKIKVALDAITSGSEGEKVASLIKAALDASKEINANDRVDAARSKANGKLKAAKKHAGEEALQEAEQELREANKMFQDLKGII